MGREAKTEYDDGRERAAVKAHLDSFNLQLTGGKKLTVALGDVKSATVDGDRLKVAAGRTKFTLALGAREAELWRKKILSPPGLGEKLGFKPGKSVTLVGAIPPEVVDAAKGFEAQTAARFPAALKGDIAVVVLPAGKEAQFIRTVAGALGPSTAAWLVYAKGGAVNGDDIIGLARREGLKDTKVARISAIHAALRFIKDKR